MQNLFAMAGHFVVVLADNTLGAEADQESIHDFVVGVTVFGAKLLAGVVFNLWTPATTVTEVAISFIDLGLVDTSLVARDEEDDDADNDVIEASKDGGVKVRHVLLVF